MPGNAQHRTTFYCTLTRLLFMDESPHKFRAFVAPLQQVPLAAGTSSGCVCAIQAFFSRCLRLQAHCLGPTELNRGCSCCLASRACAFTVTSDSRKLPSCADCALATPD